MPGKRSAWESTMASTFTEIIFPAKEKKVYVPPVTTNVYRRGVLEFWFKEVSDVNTNIDLIMVMVKCPECGYPFSLMSIKSDSKGTMRECIHNNKTYYTKLAKSKCPSCLSE